MSLTTGILLLLFLPLILILLVMSWMIIGTILAMGWEVLKLPFKYWEVMGMLILIGYYLYAKVI